MKNRLYCFYISRSEYEEIRKGMHRANTSYLPNIFVEPIEYYDAKSFRALIGANPSGKEWGYNTPSGIISFSYYIDYKQGDVGVFTFDGISFYKILDFHFTMDDRVEVNLQRITEVYGFRPNTAFMLMPFRDTSLKEFYENHIKNFLKSEMKIDLLRADDFCDNDVIIETIYDQIENAEFIIAEITEVNKNVFYELGYAAGRQKDIIMILQSGEFAPFFDRTHIRRIEYSIKDPETFKKTLLETIKSIRNKRGSI